MFDSGSIPARRFSIVIGFAGILGMLATIKYRSELATEHASATRTRLILDPCALPQGRSDLALRPPEHIELPYAAAMASPPSRAPGAGPMEHEALLIVMRADNDQKVSGNPLADGALDSLFRAAFARDRETEVVIKASAAVSHRAMVRVLELGKAAGLMRFTLGTVGTTSTFSASRSDHVARLHRE
jgi:biopolymer transport protein ExbD